MNGISDGADNLTNRHGGVALVTGGRSKLYKGRRSNPNIGAGQGPMGSSGAEIGLRQAFSKFFRNIFFHSFYSLTFKASEDTIFLAV